ncbi:MAG: hypothetical protein HW377_453, partial [Actinobacteria bacterium]|nr:hypothetical protein [Actinomycetota bacterium]
PGPIPEANRPLRTDDAEGRVGDRFPLADGTSARGLEPLPFPEHESTSPTFGRNLGQSASLCVETFLKVFQVIRDLLFRLSDGKGNLYRGMRTFLQDGADLTPYSFFFFEGGWRFRR